MIAVAGNDLHFLRLPGMEERQSSGAKSARTGSGT